MTNKEATTRIEEIIEECVKSVSDDNKDVQALRLAVKALEERPKGKWELYQYQESRNKDWYCTACATIVKKPLEKKYIFCPYCGADMRGEV